MGKLYTIPGLDQPVELDVPLYVDLLPTWQTNQRPGILAHGEPRYNQHGTGNFRPGTGALMHRNYLRNGAEGQQLGYHATNDDTAVYVMIPYGEIAWQGGDGNGPGNMSAYFSCEQAENPDQDFDKTVYVSAQLAGGVMRTGGIKPENLKAHWHVNHVQPANIRHKCPHRMMFRNEGGGWDRFTALAERFRTAGGVPEAVEWAAPILPDNWAELVDAGEDFEFNGAHFHAIRMTYEARADLVRRAWGDDDAPRVGPNVPRIDPRTKKPSRVRGYFRVRAENGRWYVLARGGSRIRASALHPNVTIKAA